MKKESLIRIATTALAWLMAVVLAFSAVKQDVAVIKATQQAQYEQIEQQLQDIKSQLNRLEDNNGVRSR